MAEEGRRRESDYVVNPVPSIQQTTDDAHNNKSTVVAGKDTAGDVQPIKVDTDGTIAIDVESSTLPTGASTDAKQLPDGHNVTVDNASIEQSTGDAHNTLNIAVAGKDSSGDVRPIITDTSGRLLSKDFYLEVAMGNVPGHTIMSKFGQNTVLSASYEDIWDGGGTYPYPANATASITHIYSTDGGDNQSIEVQGLSSDGTLTVQTKTLTNTTVVALDTPLWRVFRLKNMGTTNNAGVVHASVSDKATSYAQIEIGNNQTLMALYTIPLGKTGYLIQGTNSIIGTNRTYTVDGKMSMRPYGGVFQIKKTFGLSADGTSYMVMPFPLPGKILAKTDIRVSALSSATGGLNTTFDILLVDD